MKVSTTLLTAFIVTSSLATPNSANAAHPLWDGFRWLVKSDDSEKRDMPKKRDTSEKKGIPKKSIIPVYIKLTQPRSNSGHSNQKRHENEKSDKSNTASKVITSKVISNEQIISLSKLSHEPNGTVRVGKELEKYNLTIGARENTYLRIAVYQNKLSKEDANRMFARLHGTSGFSATLRKITGNNPNVTAGHLNELQIATHASENGFFIFAIGEKFQDGIKAAHTDIDVILDNGVNFIALEAKDYRNTTSLPLDKFRADMDSLIQYKKKYHDWWNVIPVFSLRSTPNTNDLKLLKKAAESKNVKLIIGSPSQQINQLKSLER